jgi:hypothetical protein
VNAATTSEWLAAAAIGTASLLPFAAAVRIAGHDFHTTAKQATQWAHLQAAAWLLVLAWHLGPEGTTR